MRHLPLLAALLPGLAAAQTVDLAWQGRLLDAAGAPVNGAAPLRLGLWTAASGGEEVHATLVDPAAAADGYVAVRLDDVPAAAFVDADGAPRFLWVEAQWDGAALAPRQPMNTVPYAANLVGGSATLSGPLFLGAGDGTTCGGGVGAGALIYDPTRHVPRFCNGEQWIDIGRVALVDTPAGRRWSDGSAAASCEAYRRPAAGFHYDGATGDGTYLLDPDGDGQGLVPAHCDMTTDDGGWTAIVQCLPADGCLNGGARLYAVPWRGVDHRALSATQSYVLGGSLQAVVDGATSFMTEVKRTSTSATGYWIFPMHLGFFTAATGKSESADVGATVIDSNGTRATRTMRTCWSSNNSGYWVRSYRAQGGMVFLGNTAAGPTTAANTDCDYGVWDSQALIRESKTASATSMTTTTGISTHTGWGGSAYAHRVFVR